MDRTCRVIERATGEVVRQFEMKDSYGSRSFALKAAGKSVDFDTFTYEFRPAASTGKS